MQNGRIPAGGDPIRQSLREAMDLHKYFEEVIRQNIFVTSILLFSNDNAYLKPELLKLTNPYVRKKEYLVKFITGRPMVRGYNVQQVQDSLVACTSHNLTFSA